MKSPYVLKCIAVSVTLVISGAAHADSNQERTNQERCKALNASVQQTFKDAVHKRVPKQDPSSFVQDGYDIKGLMKQDVASGLSKLMNLNFGSIIDSLVNKAMESVTRRAEKAFSSGVNKILQEYNLPGVTLQGVTTQGIPNLSTFNWGPGAQSPVAGNDIPQVTMPPIANLPGMPGGPSVSLPPPRIEPKPPAPPVAPAAPANPYTRGPGPGR